ncbi:S-adenosyl-L-methionine-dependent methyltransferase [Collybia nuda]|uniref:Arsenite methyltransferase n=1 Tax=Collybia nuda TaxID=64659 RepID=A0A9P5YHF0_9AGAR|nr:S-adenosyl-L-methionine-dependent methyltransferase [Collybia nuda]
MSSSLSDAELVKAVQDAYGAKALMADSDDRDHTGKVAASFGYTPAELLSIPSEANLGLSCGNPVGAATLKEGETVLDLGSGAGMDVFLAATKVGESGKVVGIDGSLDMIGRARRAACQKKFQPPRVSFVHAQLTEPLPIIDGSVDCVLSNCVVNLLPLQGKRTLFDEVRRVLKAGGRIVLDDIIAKRPLDAVIKDDLASYVGCIAGAIQLEEYQALLRDAGITDAVFVDTKNDLNVYYTSNTSACCSTQGPTSTSSGPTPALSVTPDFDANEWVVQSSPALMSHEELAAFVGGTGDSGDFVAVDGGRVKGSVNWPAQTFYDDLPRILEKYKNKKKVVFYCGSSSGRGPRCAGWYQDYLNETGTTTSQAYILQGGVKAWLAKYAGDDNLVDQVS